MGGFAYAGSLLNSAPVVRTFQVAETCYTGQLLKYANMVIIADALGDVGVLDVATQAAEDDEPIAGICTSVYTTGDAGYSGTTGYGDTATADTTQAAQRANSPVDMTLVKVTLAIPYACLINGPVYNAAYGEVMPELVATSTDATGVTVTHANDTAFDIKDDYCMCYCREGANKGHYRQVATAQTGTQAAGVAYPYAITAGDVYVVSPGVPGNCGLQIGGTANYIDGATPLNASLVYYGVYLHAMDLEVKGKENLTFTFLASGVGTLGFLGL
jgi:hypothetical protein